MAKHSWSWLIFISKKGKDVCKPREAHMATQRILVFCGNWEYCYSPLDGMLVHRRVTPSSMSPVPIYTPGWRETMWGKVSCLRRQHDGRDWASSHRPSDLKSYSLTTTPQRRHWYEYQSFILIGHISKSVGYLLGLFTQDMAYWRSWIIGRFIELLPRLRLV